MRVSPPTKNRRTRASSRADQVEHQRDAIGVAGLGEAIELVFGCFGHGGLGGEKTAAIAGVVGWAFAVAAYRVGHTLDKNSTDHEAIKCFASRALVRSGSPRQARAWRAPTAHHLLRQGGSKLAQLRPRLCGAPARAPVDGAWALLLAAPVPRALAAGDPNAKGDAISPVEDFSASSTSSRRASASSARDYSAKAIDGYTHVETARKEIEDLRDAVSALLGAVADNGSLATLGDKALTRARDKLKELEQDTRLKWRRKPSSSSNCARCATIPNAPIRSSAAPARALPNCCACCRLNEDLHRGKDSRNTLRRHNDVITQRRRRIAPRVWFLRARRRCRGQLVDDVDHLLCLADLYRVPR